MVLEDPSEGGLECPTALTERLDQIRHIVEKGKGRLNQPIKIVGALIGNGLKVGVAAFPFVGEGRGEIVSRNERGRQDDDEDEAGQLKAKRGSKLHLASVKIGIFASEGPFE
jgi:hypothetical protein